MDRKEWAHALSRWHSPQEFRKRLDELRREHPDCLTTPGFEFFRDAYCAEQFAVLDDAQKVRLVEAIRPDFEVKTSGTVKAFEVTEADTPGRKRNKEFKADSKAEEDARASGKVAEDEPFVTHFPVEKWATSEIAEASLRAAAARKNDDRYEPQWGLVIYLNLIEFDAHQTAIEGLMTEATAAAKDRFAEVWVVWKGCAYNTWLHGERGSRVMRPPAPAEDTEDHRPEPLSSILRPPDRAAED